MDPEILINSPESDEDLFDIGYPPSSGQQTDLSQASERSRVRSAISVPHTSRHRSRSSSPNEIPPTPDRSQASPTPPARANSQGRNRYSQLQSPHHRQPASLAAPGHSQRRSRHSTTEPERTQRCTTEPELRSWTVIRLQRRHVTAHFNLSLILVPTGFTKSPCTYIPSSLHPLFFSTFSSPQLPSFCLPSFFSS
ncbi:hypothetical protein OYC64_000992 [Pagothenia borchgrevinki]|uniref:Uncharacterized protein n=1 Tax=Pagothenia borchgrevinki TaxID=8213 RepID=A0ABD2HEG2_PAGBO